MWKVQEAKGLQEMDMVHEKQEMKKVQEGTGRRRWCRRCRSCKRYKGRNRSKEGHKLEEAQELQEGTGGSRSLMWSREVQEV